MTDRVRILLDASSMGIPAVRELQAQSSPEQVAEILRRLEEFQDEPQPEFPNPAQEVTE